MKILDLHKLQVKEAKLSLQFHPPQPTADCEILSVDPPQPVEFTPISIKVVVRNPSTEPFSGSVIATGAAAGGGSVQVKLPAGQGLLSVIEGQGTPSRTVTVSGVAPAAGQNVSIQVNLSNDQPEAPSPFGTASFPLNIAANYQFSIDTLHCLNPRSKYNDTLKGSCQVLFGDQPLANCHPRSPLDVPQATQSEEYGDHSAGDVIPITFCFTGFGGVPGLAPDLNVSYDFENSGNTGIFSNCDGTVASDTITARSDVLAQQTAANGIWSETRHYHGTNSPLNCGEASNYEVKFTFTRLSMVQASGASSSVLATPVNNASPSNPINSPPPTTKSITTEGLRQEN